MASAKYGAVITDMKGKIGGTVFKGTKMGSVVQNKQNRSAATSSSGKLTKADAGRLIQTQRNLGQVAAAWRNLTDTDRLAWTTAAPDFPFLNKFGEAYVASGYQLYMQVNSNLLNIAQTVIDTPPAPGDIDNCPSFVVAEGAGVGLSLEWTGTVPAGYVLVLYGTANISEGRRPQPGMFKAVSMLPAAQASPYDLTADYEAVFGSQADHANIWFQGKLTKADAGRQGQPYTAQCIY